jgi:hypothetical protein
MTHSVVKGKTGRYGNPQIRNDQNTTRTLQGKLTLRSPDRSADHRSVPIAAPMSGPPSPLCVRDPRDYEEAARAIVHAIAEGDRAPLIVQSDQELQHMLNCVYADQPREFARTFGHAWLEVMHSGAEPRAHAFDDTHAFDTTALFERLDLFERGALSFTISLVAIIVQEAETPLHVKLFGLVRPLLAMLATRFLIAKRAQEPTDYPRRDTTQIALWAIAKLMATNCEHDPDCPPLVFAGFVRVLVIESDGFVPFDVISSSIRLETTVSTVVACLRKQGLVDPTTHALALRFAPRKMSARATTAQLDRLDGMVGAQAGRSRASDPTMMRIENALGELCCDEFTEALTLPIADSILCAPIARIFGANPNVTLRDPETTHIGRWRAQALRAKGEAINATLEFHSFRPIRPDGPDATRPSLPSRAPAVQSPLSVVGALKKRLRAEDQADQADRTRVRSRWSGVPSASADAPSGAMHGVRSYVFPARYGESASSFFLSTHKID